MKKGKRTSPVLVVCLSIIMVFLFLCGFVLKATAFMGNELYRDTPIPALPFIYLFDSSYRAQLDADRVLAEQRHEMIKPIPVETGNSGVSNGVETVDPSKGDNPIQAVTKTVYVKGKVGADYFDDALFIGDSRTDGLFLYSPFEGADYFSGKGMTMYTLFDKPGRDGKTMLIDLLDKNTYGKIYIMLGINELGSDLDALAAKFSDVVGQLKRLEPEAIIVIQANLSVDEKTSSSTWYLTADRIHDLNSRMSAIADEEKVFYLDANPLFCDEDGYLKKELSGDGVHLYAKHYEEWTAWLLKNAFIKTEVPVDR